MKPYPFLPALILILRFVLLPAQAGERPNVLFIAVDDLRPQLGCYGDPIAQSPNIDRLAAEGSLFTRTYCNIPVCGASRASLLGGMRPGFYRYHQYFAWLEKETPQATPINTTFKGNGYTTLSIGKIYHHIQDNAEGWDRAYDSIGESGWKDYAKAGNVRTLQSGGRGPSYEMADVPDLAYRDGRLAQMAIHELEHLAKTGEPFFLALGFLKPPLPFNAPKKYWDLYDPEDLPVPEAGFRPENAPPRAFHSWGELRNYDDIPREGPLSDAVARKLIHGYYACVSATDAQVGKVLRALERTGLADNTIVVLWGDHGYNLREHGLWCKHCIFETSLHVPLIIKAPGMAPASIEGIAEFVDLYPTLCELAGLRKPAHLEGSSLVPMMKDPSNPGDGIAVSRWGNGFTLVQGDYFYTEWRDADDALQARMLFDHSKDPEELNNVAENPLYSGAVQQLSETLRRERGPTFFLPVVEKSTN
jgi:arylsulfatase A-like enzyme